MAHYKSSTFFRPLAFFCIWRYPFLPQELMPQWGMIRVASHTDMPFGMSKWLVYMEVGGTRAIRYATYNPYRVPTARIPLTDTLPAISPCLGTAVWLATPIRCLRHQTLPQHINYGIKLCHNILIQPTSGKLYVPIHGYSCEIQIRNFITKGHAICLICVICGAISM